jgi:hypothetical protein
MDSRSVFSLTNFMEVAWLPRRKMARGEVENLPRPHE